MRAKDGMKPATGHHTRRSHRPRHAARHCSISAPSSFGMGMATVLFAALCNVIGCSYGLQCYTTTNASKDVQSADSTLEVCESEAENCLTVVSKEKLRTLNPQLANETALPLPLPPLFQSHGSTNPNSSSALFDNISVLVTSSSIEHQACFPCAIGAEGNAARCQSAPNTNQQTSFVCCCNTDRCNSAPNIDVPPNYLRKSPHQESGDDGTGGGGEEDGEGGLSRFGRILIYTLVPAALVTVLLVAVYIFTSCKFSKLNHLIFGSGSAPKCGYGQRNMLGGQKGGAGAEMLGVGVGGGGDSLLDENRALLRTIDLSQCPLIGQGKFGQVYKLHKHFLGHDQVAIKVFYLTDRNSWLKEVDIYSMRAVKENSCILRLLAADDRGPEGAWIVTEYHPLGSIYDYLKQHNQISPHAVVRISESFFSGLAFLHEGFSGGIRIAHRDVKSRNILVKRDFTACIADFGLAMELHPDQEIGCTHSQVGTRRYMAPEVLEGAIIFTAEAFLRIDVYAASLVLWELLNCCSIVGQNTHYSIPFEAELGPTPSPEEINVYVAERRLRPTIPPVCRHHPMLSVLCETTEECWDHDCEARLSAMCVQQRLSRLVASLPQHFSPHCLPPELLLLPPPPTQPHTPSSSYSSPHTTPHHRSTRGVNNQVPSAGPVSTFFFPNGTPAGGFPNMDTRRESVREPGGAAEATIVITTSTGVSSNGGGGTAEHVDTLTPTDRVHHQEESPSCFFTTTSAMGGSMHQTSNSVV